MRFISNDQRRAVFANMFAKRTPSKLEMFTDESGKLMVSAENIPTTSFELATDISPVEAKRIISQLDEESLAGVKKVSLASPKVMKAYEAESGFYSGDEDRIPFGRTDTPKIVAEADLRRGSGRPGKDDSLSTTTAKDISRGAFQNIYHNVNLPDEGGASITTDLPYDLLEEEYLMQVYDDYNPPKDKWVMMQPILQDLEDEVWRTRATWRLENPDTMEARAWRMGHKPKVGVETFVELPLGKRGRPIGSKNKPKEERSLSEVVDDIVKERHKDIAAVIDNRSLHDEDVVNFKTVADFLLTPGNLGYANTMDNALLDNMIDYTTSYWGGKYGLLRSKLIEEKDSRINNRSEFSKIGGYEVTKVDPCILKDYAGMNWHAAKAMGFDDYPIKKKEVLVDERLGPKMVHKTVNHEIYEDKHMVGGDTYWDAHKEALKHEV